MGTNDIKVRIIGEDDASSKFDKVSRSALSASESLDAFGRSTSFLSNTLSTAAGFALATAGIHGIESSLLACEKSAREFYSTMETGSISMAGTLISMTTLNGQTLTWGQSLAMSKELMTELNDQAIKTGASTKEISDVYRAMLPMALSAGMTSKQTMEIASTLTTTGKAMGMQGEMLMRDISDIVSGKNASRTKLGTILGITNEDIANAKTQAGGLYKFLDERLQGEREANDHYLQSLEGRVNHLKEAISRSLGKGFDPVFKGITEQAKNIADQFVQVKEDGTVVDNEEMTKNLQSAGITLTEFGTQMKEIGSDLSVVIIPGLKLVGGLLKYGMENAHSLATELALWYTAGKLTNIYHDITGAINGTAKAQTFLGQSFEINRNKMLAQAEAAKAVEAAKCNLSGVQLSNSAGVKSAQSSVSSAVARESEAAESLRQVQIQNEMSMQAELDAKKVASAEQQIAIEERIAAVKQTNAAKEQIASERLVAATEAREAAELRLQEVKAASIEKEIAAQEALERAIITQNELTGSVERTVVANNAMSESAIVAANAQASGATEAAVAQDALTESIATTTVANESDAEASIAAGEAKVDANEVSIASQDALTESVTTSTVATVENGAESTATGVKHVTAATESTAAQTVLTESVMETTVAEEEAGLAAAETGEKSVMWAGLAETATRAWATAAMLLKDNWILVAFAVWEAVKAINAAHAAKQAETVSNDGMDYYYGNDKYVLKDGEFYKVNVDPGVTATDAFGNQVQVGAGREYTDLQPTSDPDAIESLNTQFSSNHYNDPENVSARAIAEAQQNLLNMKAKYPDSESSKVPNGSRGRAPDKPREYTETVPIGQEVAADALNNYWDGQKWTGNLGSDGQGWCDDFTHQIYQEVFDSLGKTNPFAGEGVVNDANFKSKGAYHYAGDGYIPKPGDLVDAPGHVGIYVGNDQVRSRQSSMGVHTVSLEDFSSIFGGIQGYGSIEEASGGVTTTKKVQDGDKAAIEQAKKYAKAADDAGKLFTQMADAVNSYVGSDRANDQSKLAEDIKKKQLEINKYKDAGVYTGQLDAELKVYKSTKELEIVSKWRKSWNDLKKESRDAQAQLIDDSAGAAEAEYDSTMFTLGQQLREKNKSIMVDANDKQAAQAVLDWYSTKVELAYRELTEKKIAASMKFYETERDEATALLELNEKSVTEANAMQVESYNAQIARLKTILETERLTYDQRVKYEQQLAEANKGRDEVNGKVGWREAIDPATSEIQKENASYKEIYTDTWNSIDNDVKKHFENMLSFQESFSSGIKDGLKGIAESLDKMIIDLIYQMTVVKPLMTWFQGMLQNMNKKPKSGFDGASLLSGLWGSGSSYKTPYSVGPYNQNNNAFSLNSIAEVAISSFLNYLPHRAEGGYTPEGLTLVGEKGPELVQFNSPSRIYDAKDSRKIMNGSRNSSNQVVMNVYTQDAQSFTRSRSQIYSGLSRMVDMGRRNL